MIRLIALTIALFFFQSGFAESSKTVMDMSAANKAHASIKVGDKKAEPFWSKDQARQAEIEKKYKEQISANPDNKKTYAYLAGLYLTNNKTAKAIDAYQDAITHDSENPKLFAAISIAYLHHAKYDMAKAMADEALRLDPKLTQVSKINEYIVAKQEAIDAASKVPAGGSRGDMMSKAPHGSVMPTASGAKPTDSIHKPK